MTRLLALADVHIGAGQNLGRAPGDRLRDQEEVLERIFALADERAVDAILLAGDLFEGPTITPEQIEVFVRPFELLEGRIPLIAVSGNSRHDLALQPTNALQPLRHVPGVSVYSRPALHDLGPVQIAAMPWVSPARLVASMDGDVDRDRVNARAAELLVKVADGLADPRVKPTVLMLHGSLSGASLPAGISTDELREPVIPVEELLDLGYAAIVGGHIHVSQYTVGEEGWNAPLPFGNGSPHDIATSLPLALYTGSPLPLNFGETNDAHGCWILDVGDGLTRAEFVPIPSRPLVRTVFDIAGVPVDEYMESVYDAAAWPEVADAIVKVSMRCTQAQQRRLDLARLREAVLGAGAHTVKIDVETVREQRSRVDGVTGEVDPFQAFEMWVAANPLDPELATAVRDQFQADLETVGA